MLAGEYWEAVEEEVSVGRRRRGGEYLATAGEVSIGWQGKRQVAVQEVSMVHRRRGWEGVALEGVLGGGRGGKFWEVAGKFEPIFSPTMFSFVEVQAGVVRAQAMNRRSGREKRG